MFWSNAPSVPGLDSDADRRGYSWWDMPLFNGPYWDADVVEQDVMAPEDESLGPGPRTRAGFRALQGGVLNPGGIQSDLVAPESVDWRRMQTLHTGTMNAAFADGSVQTLSGEISSLTLQRLGQPDDGAVLDSDFR